MNTPPTTMTFLSTHPAHATLPAPSRSNVNSRRKSMLSSYTIDSCCSGLLYEETAKPCKFYQLGSCPLTAQQCSFAHFVPAPAPRACRYYLQGYCKDGILCRYLHINWPGVHFLGGSTGPKGSFDISHHSRISPTPFEYLTTLGLL